MIIVKFIKGLMRFQNLYTQSLYRKPRMKRSNSPVAALIFSLIYSSFTINNTRFPAILAAQNVLF